LLTTDPAPPPFASRDRTAVTAASGTSPPEAAFFRQATGGKKAFTQDIAVCRGTVAASAKSFLRRIA
jgi:hypothetical protein